MSAALESAISETKDVLQPLFAKPKMSTKLLSKPPFRFIHDIVSATLRATRFPNGFFSLDELDSSNFKDSKSAKVSFLNKLIHLVNVGNGSALDVSPTKIVAGLEPLSTNILLTTFGRLAQDETIDRSGLIQHCLNGKGIEEFRNKNSSSLADTTNIHSEEASPEKPDSPTPTENTLIEHNDSGGQHTIMEQIMTCNEDIEQTQSMVSKLVAKPKCSDKLLSKPPFRFIHDLLMAIASVTQFDLSEIFSDDELLSSNVKEKQAKLQFLEKLISSIEVNLDMSLNVKPAKIISGLEPERTRYLLQVFTVVASSKCLAPKELKDASKMKSNHDPTKSEPQDEEPKLSIANGRTEKENILPAEESLANSVDDIAGVVPIIDEEPPAKHSPTTKNIGVDRPETQRRARPSTVRERNSNATKGLESIRPATAILKDLDERAGVSRAVAHSHHTKTPEEPKIDDMSIFQKIIQEQKAREETSSPRTQVQNIDVSLSDVIQIVTQSAAKCVIHGDFETIMNERNNWIAEQEGSKDVWKRHKQRGEHLDPLRMQLKSLESQVDSQVAKIKRLEQSVKKNDDVLRRHGVTHAY